MKRFSEFYEKVYMLNEKVYIAMVD
ncbi:hypothetical protein HOE425_332086 [Hoeflea sp. EC-HK425]|nr:hypothetical protein HOE425_332086 [Hoeflea sp. EC-HK425]